MKIIINDQVYQLTEEQRAQLVTLFRGKIEEQYGKLDPQWRLAAKAASRGLLGWIEDQVKQKSGIEEARRVRPGKKDDPVLHLFSIGERILGDMIAHVAISLTTGKETSTITSFTATLSRKGQDQDGGSLDTDGNIGLREDNSSEILRSDLYPALSNGTALHS